MTSQESAVLLRIEEKLDKMSEALTTVVTKAQTFEKTIEKHEHDLDTLKAAYYKALGILAFLSMPGVASIFWLAFKTP